MCVTASVACVALSRTAVNASHWSDNVSEVSTGTDIQASHHLD